MVRMRVLLLNQTFFPDQAATSQQLLDFARFLRDEGCEVTVMAARRAYGDPTKTHAAEEVVDGIRVIRVASTGFGRKSFFHRLIDGLSFEMLLVLRLLFFRRQDVVIAFTSPPLIGFAALLFCTLHGGKSVQWMMDLNPEIAFAVGYLKEHSFLGRFFTALLRVTVRYSDYVVVLDRWMRQKMLKHGVRSEQIVVVPPWPVSASPAMDSELGKLFRERHGITQKFVVLYSGNHSIAHPLGPILHTALAMREDPDVLFLFIGGGLRESEVKRFREVHALENIRQLPFQPRELLQQSLSAADLHLVVMGPGMSGLVHVSKIYGVLSMGRPYAFLGPRASHVGDLLEECPFGFLVEDETQDGLFNVIEAAKKFDAEKLGEIYRANTAYVADRCSIQHSLATFLSQVIEPLRKPAVIAVHAPSRA